ncbi:MAG: type IV pilin [Thermoplasmata archaeon]|nr:type IV pilin [Thermoplasmata archaeon]
MGKKTSYKNKNGLENDEAVSAVIGVILMVAITVAIAATAYVYMTGMIGGISDNAPVIDFAISESTNTLRVSSADTGISWSDINISATDGSSTVYITMSGDVSAGDEIDLDGRGLSGDVTITFRHNPSNTMIWTHTFHDVQAS